MQPLSSNLMLTGPTKLSAGVMSMVTRWLSLSSKTASLLASQRAMYCASMVESATVFYNFEAQLTAAPPKMNMKLVVDRCVS